MASPPGSSGRKRTTQRQYSAEDQALNQIAKEAEGRLAARRAARAEAREIRLREIERQQREADEKEDTKSRLTGNNDYRVTASSRYASGSRRGSDDSGTSEDNARELKKEIAELEEKWKKVMMNNAQLDNEKQTYRYQVDILKDQLEEMEEAHIELQREHRDRCRELEQKKRDYKGVQEEKEYLKQQLEMRDELIEQYGLVFVSNESEEGEDGKKKPSEKKGTTGLVTPEAAAVLQRLQGSLDDKLKELATTVDNLEAENKKLKQQLDEEKERSALAEKYSSPSRHLSNGPDQAQISEELKNEAQREVNEYKFKLKKAEQDITQLEGTVIRLESQVKRYKQAAENSEKGENELKAEKRKLQREFREAQNQIQELTTEKEHLQKRIEKLKQTRINVK